MHKALSASKRINLRQMRALVAISHYRNFTQASQAIGLSQPAFSALVAQLERELDVRLVDRTTRSLKITEAGEEFIAASRRILDAVENAVHDAQDHWTLRRGRLSIAALPSICTGLLPIVLREFHAKYPEIRTSVTDLLGDDLINFALSERVDFALGYIGADRQKDFEEIYSDRLVAVGSPTHLTGGNRTISWRDLQGKPIVAMAFGSSVRRLVDAGMHKSGTELDFALEDVQIPTALAYARSGLAVALLPSSITADIQDRSLVIKTIVEPEIERPISIIRPAHGALSPPADKFLQMLREMKRDL